MATTYRIHPSVGIARVGNQEGTTQQDYFIGPVAGPSSGAGGWLQT